MIVLYSKTSGRLWQYYRNKSNDNIANSQSFQFKVKITEKTPPANNKKMNSSTIKMLKVIFGELLKYL